MSKRAVRFNFGMIKSLLVKGYRAESIECTRGIPEDAVFVEMFHPELVGMLTVVFDSDSWHEEPSSHTIKCPMSGIVPVQEMEYEKHYGSSI